MEDVKIEEAKWAKDVLIERIFEQQEEREEMLVVGNTRSVNHPVIIEEEEDETEEIVTDSDMDSVSRVSAVSPGGGREESKENMEYVREQLNNLCAQVSISETRSRKAASAKLSMEFASS